MKKKDTKLLSDDLSALLDLVEKHGSGNKVNEKIKALIKRRIAGTKLGGTVLEASSMYPLRKQGEDIWICPKCNVYWIGLRGSKCPECGGA